MGSNFFGNLFKITTFGESHGQAIGVVIDGCPANLKLSEVDINAFLALRAPGKNSSVSLRKESDKAKILSGLFEGKTTGASILIMIYNEDVDSKKYEPIKDILRPSHFNYTYLEKYGFYDYKGSARSSARETAARVAAGAVAKKILKHFNIKTIAYLKQVGGISIKCDLVDIDLLKKLTYRSSIFCPDIKATKSIINLIKLIKSEGDSIGGIVEFMADGLPAGLGDPIFEKLQANLGKAMLSIPACRGFEIGEGFSSCKMKGSFHNDSFDVTKDGKIITKTNHAGGVIAGISTGMPLCGRVVFKPTASIKKTQQTLDIDKKKVNFSLPKGSKHDPCVAIRATIVVEAMLAIVLVDALLMNRSAKL